MSVHQILCLTIKILRNEDFANYSAPGTAVYTLTPRRGRPIKTRQKAHQTFLGKNSLQHTWKVLQCKQMIQKGTTKMLNRTFAAVYFYFYFTFFRGKVNFAAMS